jgi:hypothetical protein
MPSARQIDKYCNPAGDGLLVPSLAGLVIRSGGVSHNKRCRLAGGSLVVSIPFAKQALHGSEKGLAALIRNGGVSHPNNAAFQAVH